MTNDRDEEFLRTKLTDGLHPAEVDLWPAVILQIFICTKAALAL